MIRSQVASQSRSHLKLRLCHRLCGSGWFLRGHFHTCICLSILKSLQSLHPSLYCCTVPFQSINQGIPKAVENLIIEHFYNQIFFKIELLLWSPQGKNCNFDINCTCNHWNFCWAVSNEKIQITKVRTLSNTIRVVADNSLVTLIPAKLKKAIENIVPE